MKILFFDDYKLGVLRGDNVVDLTSLVADIPRLEPQDVIEGVISGWDEFRPKIEAFVQSQTGVPLTSVHIRPPLPKPTRIVCMAVNYHDGVAEPHEADAFHKAPDTIIGDGDTMVLGDIPATVFEGEAELALVIGKRAKDVSEADAMSYVFGYMNFIDGSARGLKPGGFYSMKSRTTYAPTGPFIVTADEVPDPYALRVRLWNDGDLMQDYLTKDMAHRIDESIAFVTKAHQLEPGDIVAMGTNHNGLHPFQDGQTVEIETEGLGRLSFKIRDDLKRTWPRETRRQRIDRGERGTPPQATGKYAPEAAK